MYTNRMEIFDEMEKMGHEEVLFNYVEDVDLKMIISLHDTTPGRTLGGLRMREYSNDADMIADTLKLSQIMTYQSAAADVDCGGGSAILWDSPKNEKREAYFRGVGRLLESLKGRIIVYPDMGTNTRDFRYIQRETENTIYRSAVFDESRSSLETSVSAEITALGIYWGIKACAKIAFGTSDLKGLKFAVQGLGKVGKSLVDYLKGEDVVLTVTDVVYDSIKEVQDKHKDVKVVMPEKIFSLETDFFVPCAVGSVINRKNIGDLKCRVIAGSAYNIFETADLLDEIHRMGIIYAPDFVISAGELLLLDRNLKLGNPEKAKAEMKILYSYMIDLLSEAAEKNIPPYKLAGEGAMKRYRQIDQIKNILC